jgi:FkbM family methyltransferase
MQLVYHHVGARGGSAFFDFPRAFDADIVEVLYEADADAVPHAEAAGVGNRRNRLVLPYFLGESEGEVEFHVNYCPFTSSSRRFNPALAAYSTFFDGYDYVAGDVHEVIETRRLRSTSLDRLTLGAGAQLDRPDLISLDTQGSEDAILRGARGVLERHVVAVLTEVAFRPIYEDGPVFADIDRELRGRGFIFAGFHSASYYAPFAAPIGARAKAFLTFGDVLYFKDLDAVAAMGDEHRTGAFMKLAFIALATGYLELARLCLDRLLAAKPDALLQNGTTIAAFLRDYLQAYRDLAQLRP